MLGSLGRTLKKFQVIWSLWLEVVQCVTELKLTVLRVP